MYHGNCAFVCLPLSVSVRVLISFLYVISAPSPPFHTIHEGIHYHHITHPHRPTHTPTTPLPPPATAPHTRTHTHTSMPTLRFRGLPSSLVQRVASSLSPTLASIVGCDRDWFIFESVNTSFISHEGAVVCVFLCGCMCTYVFLCPTSPPRTHRPRKTHTHTHTHTFTTALSPSHLH